MIRREYTYPASLGLTGWNQVASVGSFLIALAILVFIVNVVRTQRKAKGMEDEDPWDARTLEWATSSPPPVHNFDEVPQVHALDEFWHRKYVQDEKTGTLVPVQAGGAPPHDEGHEVAATASICPAPRTGRSSRRSACRSSATASCTHGGWSGPAR